MFAKAKQLNIFERSKISYAEIDKELKVELAVLGGLDIFTNAHVLGVANNTSKICEAMGFDHALSKQCILGAYMHDVGKIKIPSNILQKNGKLTDEEFEIMKLHTVYGYEICMSYEQFKYLAPIARYHHENLDGSGYPDHLTDDEIPEEAKLIKIADIWDALTQRRQYKEGFKPSKAADILLGDIKKGKTGSKYLYYLLLCVIDEYEDKNKGNIKELKETQDHLVDLKDLDKIYKQIYDRGYSESLAKKLKKYELPAGYDLSTNTNLLAKTNKKIEKLIQVIKDTQDEIVTLKKQCKEAKSLITRKEEWNVSLFGRKI
ncbi:MAG: HD domain-containing protein [Clostridia bacterium]|nr:HD domain-containing protein [Clostridia bacterium]